MSAPRAYTRLPGRGYRMRLPIAAARHTLWLGGDHLLSVDWWGYTEDYRRFAYSEILSISVRKTQRFAVSALVWGGLVAALVGWSFGAGEVWGVVLRVFAGIFAIPFLLNLALGPTCKVTLRTAVHSEELPAWGRRRAFRRGIERLRPRILEAQAAPPPRAAA